MNYPKFLLSQVTSSWPTGPTRFVEIPRITDLELRAFCALSMLWDQPYSREGLREIAADFDRRLAKHPDKRAEILRYVMRECPTDLAKLRLNSMKKPEPPPPPPPTPTPPGPPRPPVASEDKPVHWLDLCDLVRKLSEAIKKERDAKARRAPWTETYGAELEVKAAAKKLAEEIKGAFVDDAEFQRFREVCPSPISWWLYGPFRELSVKPPAPSTAPVCLYCIRTGAFRWGRPEEAGVNGCSIEPSYKCGPLQMTPTAYYPPYPQPSTLPTVYVPSGGPSAPTTVPPTSVVQSTYSEGLPSGYTSPYGRVLPGMLPGLLTTSTPGLTTSGGMSPGGYMI